MGSKYYATAAAAHYVIDHDRIEAITAIRKQEQVQMQAYMEHKGCLMFFLQKSLDDETAKPCGNCMNCNPASALSVQCDELLLQSAKIFLKNMYLPIEPRKQWPRAGLFSRYNFSQQTIASDLRAETGRALCIYGDGSLGALVHDGKYRTKQFDQQLVEACINLYKKWDMRPTPTWVTCIPSLNLPDLVPDFAKRLANALGLPFRPCLHKVVANRPQKNMENSTLQVKNLDGVFALDAVLLEPCLLVDDIVDSRWTFTVAAALLRQAGCSAVYPLALAMATGTNS